MVEGYCVKCKAKREMKDGKEVTMKGKGGVERKAMKGICPNAERFYERIISIPMYPSLKDQEQELILKNIDEILKRRI